MGILYKRLGVPLRAVSSLQKALDIKRETIGHQSLPVAKILEELGKFHLERSELAKAFPYFQECYEIRKKILRKSTDEDIQRISCLLLYLHKNIERQIREKSHDRLLSTAPAATKLMTLQDKLANGLRKTLGLEETEQSLEQELTQGKSLAAKVMADIFKRQQAQDAEVTAKRAAEYEFQEKERQKQ